MAVCKDKSQLELFAFRVYVMLVYKNATIFNLTDYHVAELLRCTLSKARQLIAAAKHSPFFSYSEKRKSLRALSLKSEVWKTSKNGKYDYRSDFVFQFSKRYVSLNEMVKLLRGVVIMKVIMQAQGKPSTNGANKESLPYIMIYQTTFGNMLNLSQGAVSKLVKHLSEIGWIQKTEQAFYVALRNGDSEKAKEYSRTHFNCKLIQKESSRYYCRAKSVAYTYFGAFGLGYLISDTMRDAFKHIIWTHNKRVAA